GGVALRRGCAWVCGAAWRRWWIPPRPAWAPPSSSRPGLPRPRRNRRKSPPRRPKVPLIQPRPRRLRPPRAKRSSCPAPRRSRPVPATPMMTRATRTGAVRDTAMTTTMMTMTTTSTMTRRSAASARTRILAWIMVIVTLAAVVIVGATARVMFARVEARANIELAHEAEKLHDFAERPDPTTGEAYREVAELLSAHLQHNLPEHDETLFSLLNGEPHR